MFDAHCHLDQLPEIGLQARLAERSGLVLAGVDPAGWARQLALVRLHPGVVRCVGLHPWVVARARPEAVDAALVALEEALRVGGEGLVGVGELGLDHGRAQARSSYDLQRRAFREQLALARTYAMPVVLHGAAAWSSVIEVLRADGLPAAGGMAHSFGGSRELAQTLVSLGLCVSLSPRAFLRGGAAALACAIPEDRLLVETDADLAHPDPGLAALVLAVADARGEGPDWVARYTERNARRLFRLPVTTLRDWSAP